MVLVFALNGGHLTNWERYAKINSQKRKIQIKTI